MKFKQNSHKHQKTFKMTSQVHTLKISKHSVKLIHNYNKEFIDNYSTYVYKQKAL